MPTYSLTLRSDLNRRLTTEEMGENLLYLQNRTGGSGTVTEHFESIEGDSVTTSSAPSSSLLLFLNGVLLREGPSYDYTVSGSTISLLFSLEVSDRITAVY